MRRLALCAILSTSLSGCFFVYIPGSAIRAVSDGITGAEGEHCVPESIKPGDRVKLQDGSIATVKSTSGTSTRCKSPDKPIRAKIEKTA